MKRHLSLSVSEFHQLLAALCAQAERELSSTRARMDALRTEELPPG